MIYLIEPIARSQVLVFGLNNNFECRTFESLHGEPNP